MQDAKVYFDAYKQNFCFVRVKNVVFGLIIQIQMQDMISQLYSLTLDLKQQNRNLLKLIEKYSSNHNVASGQKSASCYQQSLSKQMQLPQPKLAKFPDVTSISRVSNSTIKQNSLRCKSAQSVKQSRLTKKNLSASKPTKIQSKDSRAVARESDLMRLKKITQKTLGKISGSVLLKKKSKIYHFQTHY